MSTRNRQYKLIDTFTDEIILKTQLLSDCQMEKRNMNKQVGEKRFACEGTWVINKSVG
jgi:hypothetical protein